MNNQEKTQDITKYDVDKKCWEEKIRPYYLNKRGILDVKEALKDFNIPDSRIDQLIQEIKKKREEKGTKVLSTFGEIYCSCVLEKEKDIYLLSLRWPQHLFEIETGLDLIGIDLKNLNIAYAEVKASESDEKSSVISQKVKLRTQLEDKRLSEKFDDTVKDFGTKLWVKDEVKRLALKGKITNITPELVEQIIDRKTKYHRYGALVHSETTSDIDFSIDHTNLDDHCREIRNCKQTCSEFCQDRNPIHFLDIIVKDIKDRVDDLIILELEVVAKIDLNRDD